MFTNIIFLRHGETDWNKEQLFQGQTDIELNEVGQAQAARAAEILAKRNFAAIYSSDLSRAKQTAEKVANKLNMGIVVDKRLREIDVGTWAGKKATSLTGQYSDLWSKYDSGIDFRRSGTGETEAEACQRVSDAVKEYITLHLGKTILVVSHGLVSRLAITRIANIAWEERMVIGSIGNCHWSEISITEQRCRIISHNCSG